MKNTFKIFVIIALAAIIIGCTKKTASQSEIGGQSEANEQSEKSEIVIDASWADDSEYDPSSVHFFIDSNNPKIMFTTNVPVKDFIWVSLGTLLDQNDEILYEITDVLYLIKDFLPKKPLVVTSGEMGVHWSNAISYLDENGQRKYFAVWNNDYEPEDERYNGGLSLSEFTPRWTEAIDNLFQPAIIGRYRNGEDTDGNIILDIAEDLYKFNVNGALYAGTYEVYYSANLWCVYLPDIKWAHNWIESYNNAQITSYEELDNLDQDKMTDKETYGVEFWMEDNELVFQNYGNSMAPYVIFDEVGDKFVRLRLIDVFYPDQ
ncbi:hypothetical protein R84B8_03145 [Treponema sp. R8-4-B8]